MGFWRLLLNCETHRNIILGDLIHTRLLFYKTAHTRHSWSNNRWRSLTVMNIMSHCQCWIEFALHSTIFYFHTFTGISYSKQGLQQETKTQSHLWLSYSTRSHMETITNAMEPSPSWEANNHYAIQEFPTFYGTQMFITIFTQACH
jgi:hypothetical protein